MSTINLLLKRDAAYILSEAAYIDPANNLLGAVGNKVIMLPQIPAGVVVRGHAQWFWVVWAALNELAPMSFAELRECAGNGLRTTLEKGFEAAPQHPRDIDIGAAGWCSATGAPASFFVSTSDIHVVTKPWEVFDPGPLLICPETESMLNDFPDRSGIDFERDGWTILHRQRQLKAPPMIAGGPEACLVGGFAQVTRITSNSIETRVRGSWPDRIGEAIRPEAF